MNMQAIMQQAKKMQKDMLKAKEEVDSKEYVSKKSMVEVVMKGTKEVVSIKITADSLDKDEIEMLEDSLLLAINENIKAIDKDTQDKLGKFGNLSGLI